MAFALFFNFTYINYFTGDSSHRQIGDYDVGLLAQTANNPKHWYWDYCWHKKGKNGKPLYKKGKAVISSVGCPQKKVRAASSAIAAKLPHRQILLIIKGDNSPPT
ncbi:hypothetical protein [Okeania sp. SIO1I7]|uniref:hypothetical protein n=1 Tax=Okeania sp. SIO1I7 TaxID=2607772 RepID=UPI0013FB4EB7|nr:hypothetical protein [Okeania sp. SIO1I7]NET29900.1 hypothetical protein [Okeania sp. SIO1I7]